MHTCEVCAVSFSRDSGNVRRHVRKLHWSVGNLLIADLADMMTVEINSTPMPQKVNSCYIRGLKQVRGEELVLDRNKSNAATTRSYLCTPSGLTFLNNP